METEHGRSGTGRGSSKREGHEMGVTGRRRDETGKNGDGLGGREVLPGTNREGTELILGAKQASPIENRSRQHYGSRTDLTPH